jgi:hypothetical protein
MERQYEQVALCGLNPKSPKYEDQVRVKLHAKGVDAYALTKIIIFLQFIKTHKINFLEGGQLPSFLLPYKE